ncbi:MAG: Hsp20/alpha crystallin family protein, partial [Flavobacteriales bacterium]
QKEEVSVEGEKYTKREFKTNAFRREFRLPNTLNVDAISAQYEGGVLFVNLPKLDETKHAELVKKIQVG